MQITVRYPDHGRVLDAPGEPSEDYPNEPGDHSVITETAFDTVGEDGWSLGKGTEGEGDDIWILSDATAPKSPSNIARCFFPEGYGGGTGPIRYVKTGWTGRTVYVALWFRLSDSWQGHSSGVNKMMFVTAAGMNAGDPLIFSAQGSGSTQRWEVRMQGGAGGTRNFGWDESDNELDDVSVVLTRGLWHFTETLVIGNDNGVENAEIHSWTNGTKTLQFTGQEILGAGDFNNVRWDPIWGGIGGTVPADMWQDIDHIYVSGK